MSCNNCSRIRKEIRTPRELVEAITLIRKKVADKTIKYLGYGADGEPFSRFSNSRHWGDIISNYFACKSCGQVIQLRAETYHGSGGKLAPKDSIGEKLSIDCFIP